MGVRVLAAVVAVPVVFGVAGCGGGGESGVASAGGARAEVSASASESLSPEDAQLKFAQCMRENGVDVPDPGSEDAKARRLGEGTSQEKLEAALDECRPLLQAGGMMPDLEDPEVRDKYAEFAQCMREQGVDVPDPGPDGKLSLPSDGFDREAVEKAREKCELDLPGFGK